jgi:hypothetical protein
MTRRGGIVPACYWLGKPETLPIPVAGDACCMKPERSGTAVIALKMGWKTGFEPATPGITIRCSNQLSYIHHWGAHSRSPAIKNASLRLHPARPAGIAVFNPRIAVPVRVAVDVGWRLPGPRQPGRFCTRSTRMHNLPALRRRKSRQRSTSVVRTPWPPWRKCCLTRPRPLCGTSSDTGARPGCPPCPAWLC